jgi:ketosteroid isomerase-like protein
MKTPIALSCALLLLLASTAACAPAQSSDPAAVVKAAYDRLNNGDLNGFMASFANDAVMLDDSGRYDGADTIRAHVQADFGGSQIRFELSDISADGGTVRYTYKAYVGNTVVDTHECVDVVSNGRIVFDGTAPLYQAECTKDPSQAFCAGH